ncbi:MAG: L-seryl-tRNA(Sec) selenium transferase [Beijerinckiaceae bacterium]
MFLRVRRLGSADESEPSAAANARLPSVDRLLGLPDAAALVTLHGRMEVLAATRAELAQLREAAMVASPTTILASIGAALAARASPSQRRVFNLTGTVLHTNLGRALMPEAAIEAVIAAMRHPSTLEYDLASGERGERDDHVRELVRELTGAEDACLVNNNAAAVLLVLATFAKGKETIVSRGELIEIGGSFRLPEIMRRAGTRLVEVGATNRTHLADFAEAISPRTGLIMKAHTSNYVIQGFTSEVPARDLSALARENSVPLFDDLGSGTLIDLTRYHLPRERTVRDALDDGADLVSFSGDKLLGGPQCGFIVGRRDLVRLCAKNHLKRSLRLDKLRLAALEATLRLYRDPDKLAETLPTLRLLSRPQGEIRTLAERMLPAFGSWLGDEWKTSVADCASQIGSGAMPIDTLPSAALVAMPDNGKRGRGKALIMLAEKLRRLPIPVIGRIRDDALLLDLRCLEDEPTFSAQLSATPV